MAPPTTLVVTLQPNSVANSVSIPISSALQTLESLGQGSAVDQAVRSIFKAGVFTDGKGTWYNAHLVVSISAS